MVCSRWIIVSILVVSVNFSSAVEPKVVPLWTKEAPGDAGQKIGPERNIEAKGGRETRRLTDISTPTLSVYQPQNPNGTAVVIAPGGGYGILAWDLEGLEVAEWFNKQGVTAFVLKYRVPRRPGSPGNGAPPQALHDGQRAISLVRHQAKEFNVNPDKIGILGFSAGGHLAAWTSTNFEKRSYEATDEADKVSCRPDFSILIYPAYLADGNELGKLKPDITVTEKTPPAFLVHAYDDPVTPESSIRYFQALKKAKVSAELHIYSKGGHGYGLRPDDKPVSAWPTRCQEWMKAQGLLGK
jgi:acetyl esterase/lipase